MELIQTKDYLLLIDEGAEIEVGNLITDTYRVWEWKDNCSLLGRKLVIAYYPLVKEAKELDSPLLPNPFEEVNVEKLALKEYPDGCDGTNRSATIYRRIFIEGYKAAQSSNKQFSLEDMKKAFQAGSEFGSAPFSGQGKELIDEEKFIQSLFTQQLPVSFEPEYKIINDCAGECGICNNSCNIEVLKTIINSECKYELVGTYKY